MVKSGNTERPLSGLDTRNGVGETAGVGVGTGTGARCTHPLESASAVAAAKANA